MSQKDERWGIMSNNPKTPEYKKGKTPPTKEKAQERLKEIEKIIKPKNQS